MSGDADRLHIVSHFPGRLRVRADRFRVKSAAAEAASRIGAEPGVSSVTASEITGSLLIVYDPARIQLDRLLPVVLVAGDLAGVAIEVDERLAGAPGQRLRRACRRLDARAREAMNGRLDIRTSVPAMFLMAGIGQFVRGSRVLPKWYELAFWSFVTFINLNPREPEIRDVR